MAEEVHISNANALFYGAGLFGVLHAFASGGAAVTGVEAISNGVPAFREPAWKNARQTLVVMGIGLGIMFFGLSALAAQVKVGPAPSGTLIPWSATTQPNSARVAPMVMAAWMTAV